MGFCGCSLYASVISASLFGIVFSAFGITSITFLISPEFQNAVRKEIPNDLNVNFLTNVTTIFYESVWKVRSNEAIYGILLASLILHSLWFLFSSLLLIGNETGSRWLLQLWSLITTVIIITDAVFTIYFIYKLVMDVQRLDLHFRNIELASLLLGNIMYYLILIVPFHKLGIVSFAVLISLVIFVCHRANEMKRKKLEKRSQKRIEYASPNHGFSFGPPNQKSLISIPRGSLSPEPAPPYDGYRDELPRMRPKTDYDNMQYRNRPDCPPSPRPYMDRGYSRGPTYEINEPEIDYEVDRDPRHREMKYRY